MGTRAAVAASAVIVMLSGCSGGWWPFGRSSEPEPNRLPAGATEYACAGGKRLLIRYTPDGKSAWVIYPDREFRLDRIVSASGSGEQFSNGVSTLATQGDETSLDSEGARQFTDCKRKPGAG